MRDTKKIRYKNKHKTRDERKQADKKRSLAIFDDNIAL